MTATGSPSCRDPRCPASSCTDLRRGTTARLTFEAGDNWPTWTPDGRKVAFSRAAEGPANLYLIDTEGSGPPERLTMDAADQAPAEWTPDGNTLIFVRYGVEEAADIWRLWRRDGQWQQSPVVESPFDDRDPALSPDGRWLAYTSDESGRREVYVRRFPDSAGERQISLAGGVSPLWRRDGNALVYLARPSSHGERPVMTEVAVSEGVNGELSIGKPQPLFASPYLNSVPIRGYDAQGGRLLMLQPEETPTTVVTLINIVQHWFKG